MSKQPPRDAPGLDLPPLGKISDTGGGLPLEKFSAALVGLLGSGDDPYQPAAVAPHEQDPAAPEPLAFEIEPAATDACEITPRGILEAMLFVGSPANDPLGSRQVAAMMRGVRAAEIDTLVAQLNAEYLARNCPYQIVEQGTGYRMVLREEHAAVAERYFGRARQARLSQAAIEVLAAVAYNQPLTLDEISKLRGTDCSRVASQLVRRELLRLERTETKPRRVDYYTTDRFLQLFGLESLADLPRSGEIEPQ